MRWGSPALPSSSILWSEKNLEEHQGVDQPELLSQDHQRIRCEVPCTWWQTCPISCWTWIPENPHIMFPTRGKGLEKTLVGAPIPLHWVTGVQCQPGIHYEKLAWLSSKVLSISSARLEIHHVRENLALESDTWDGPKTNVVCPTQPECYNAMVWNEIVSMVQPQWKQTWEPEPSHNRLKASSGPGGPVCPDADMSWTRVCSAQSKALQYM